MQPSQDNSLENFLEKFREYLEKNTFLTKKTIKQYTSQAKTILEKTKINFENEQELLSELNQALIRKLKQKNTKYTTTATTKHLLDFLQKPHLKLLIKTKNQTPKKQKKYLNYDEIKNIISQQINNPTLKAILQLQLETGLRIIELASIQTKNIQLNPQTKNLIITIKGKRGKINQTPIISLLGKKIIIALLKQNTNQDDYLFLNNQKIKLMQQKQLPKELISEEIEKQKQALYMNYYRTLKKLNLTTHDIRRAFAIKIYEITKDIAVVSKLLNHTKIETTQKYIEGYIQSINKEEIIKKII